ncbi:MAG: trigger factor [Desulfobacterales bacterium]|jgi:trigger factor|nr:trigger factor [Desulfobacterales bacterium]MDD3082917.1 trigger factor [Desulfobacterales bacterium]MDD3951871.1 trigger factor [Desulfobacterales bacterium]MDY0378370.1 trigger factor [Desulfobacterales bacterium]
MHFTVEDLSSVKKKIHVEIPEEAVAREVEAAFNRLKKKAKIKGFRPGKAPRAVLERQYRKDVYEDVVSQLVRDHYWEAVKKSECKVLGTPEIDAPEFEGKGSFGFDAVVEVSPEIGEIDYKAINLKKSRYKVDDEQIETQLKILQRNMARFEAIQEDRPVAEGDHVVVDFEGFENSAPCPDVKKTEGFPIKLGTSRIHKQFDDGLVGMKVGETRNIEVNFEDDYFNKNLAGHTVEFRTTLKEIRQEVLPEINDSFAAELGKYDNLDGLKKDIAANLERGFKNRNEQELSQQIFAELARRTSFELPEVLVEYELGKFFQEAEKTAVYNKVSMEQLGLTRESIGDKYRPHAEDQVKRQLIINQLLDQLQLELNDEELDAGMKEVAEAYDRKVEELKKYYEENPQHLAGLKRNLLEKKAISLIIENSTIEEVEAGAPLQAESD